MVRKRLAKNQRQIHKLKRARECNCSPIRQQQHSDKPLTPRDIGPASPLGKIDNFFSFDYDLEGSFEQFNRPPTPRTPEHLKTYFP